MRSQALASLSLSSRQPVQGCLAHKKQLHREPGIQTRVFKTGYSVPVTQGRSSESLARQMSFSLSLSSLAMSHTQVYDEVHPDHLVPHESKQANRIKPFNSTKGRNSLVTLQRSPLRGLRVPLVEQTPKSPFYSVRLCRLVWIDESYKRLRRSAS